MRLKNPAGMYRGAELRPEWLGALAASFETAGVDERSGQRVLDELGKFLNNEMLAHDTEAATARQTAETALKKEWGNDYAAKLETAKAAAAKLGITPAGAAALEAALGN